MRGVDALDAVRTTGSRLLPVLPLEDACLFPGASLVHVVHNPADLSAVRLAERLGGELIVLGYRESHRGPRDLHTVGTVAELRSLGERFGIAWPAIEGLDDPLFYLSGPPAMLTALTEQLRGHDVAPGDIRTDAWE